MKVLIEKYKAWQRNEENKGYEAWQRTQSKSVIKQALLLSFAWFTAFTLLGIWNRYDRNLSYSLDEIKNDAAFTLIVSLIGGIFVAWFLNRKYRRRFIKETSK